MGLEATQGSYYMLQLNSRSREWRMRIAFQIQDN